MLAFKKGKKYRLKTVDEMLAMDGAITKDETVIRYEHDTRNTFYIPGMDNYFEEPYEAKRDCTQFRKGPYQWLPWMFKEFMDTPTKKLLSHVRGLQ